jgi:hypothetical protein
MKAATDTRTGPKRSAAGNFQLANSHHETGSLQARIAVWMREAERLAGEFNWCSVTLDSDGLISRACSLRWPTPGGTPSGSSVTLH